MQTERTPRLDNFHFSVYCNFPITIRHWHDGGSPFPRLFLSVSRCRGACLVLIGSVLNFSPLKPTRNQSRSWPPGQLAQHGIFGHCGVIVIMNCFSFCTFVTCESLLNGRENVLVPASTVLQWYCGGELSRRQEEALCSDRSRLQRVTLARKSLIGTILTIVPSLQSPNIP
jgi:hypothetical protein